MSNVTSMLVGTYPVPLARLQSRFNKEFTGSVFPFGIGVGKHFTNVAKTQRTKDGIHQRVINNIAIAVGDRADFLGDNDTAKREFPAGLEAMDVVAVTDQECAVGAAGSFDSGCLRGDEAFDGNSASAR